MNQPESHPIEPTPTTDEVIPPVGRRIEVHYGAPFQFKRSQRHFVTLGHEGSCDRPVDLAAVDVNPKDLTEEAVSTQSAAPVSNRAVRSTVVPTCRI
jgi:hypothetical protein